MRVPVPFHPLLAWSPLLVALALLAPVAAEVGPPETGHHGDLEIQVRGMSSDRGTVRVAVFADSEKALFPDGPPERTQVRPSASGMVRFVFSALPHGNFAVLAYHDENGNAHLDRNRLGIPVERWGVSGRRPRIGPPDPADAGIRLEQPHQTLTIQLE